MLIVEKGPTKDTFRQIGPHIWFGPAGLVCMDCGQWRGEPVRATGRSWSAAQIEAWVHDGEPCSPTPEM